MNGGQCHICYALFVEVPLFTTTYWACPNQADHDKAEKERADRDWSDIHIPGQADEAFKQEFPRAAAADDNRLFERDTGACHMRGYYAVHVYTHSTGLGRCQCQRFQVYA